MQYVARLEAEFLPVFRGAAEKLEQEYPSYKFQVWSSPIGGATTYQGHGLGLECQFPDAADHEADCVAASIGVKHLTTEPLISYVDVEWGEGEHPDVQIDFTECAVPLTSTSIDQVSARLPELLDVFRAALRAWAQRKTGA